MPKYKLIYVHQIPINIGIIQITYARDVNV